MTEPNWYTGLSPFDVLHKFRARHIKAGPQTEQGTVAKAVDTILPKLEKMEHIKAIDYTLDWGNNRTEEMTALFDDRKVSEEEAMAHIHRGDCYNANIITMYRTQFNSVFGKEDSDG